MKEKNFKSIFIIPPQWYFLNPPSFLLHTVSGLKSNGFNVKLFDFNIDFYLSVLNKNHLKSVYEDAIKQMPVLFDYLRKNFKKGQNQEQYDDNFKAKLLKFNKIKELTGEKKEQVIKAIETIEHSISVMKDEDLFYNPEELTAAITNIDFCLEIASLVYYPSQIQMGSYTDPFFKLDFDCMLKTAQSKNMFTDFYEKNLKKITELKPAIIGVSIDATSQMVSALTLLKILKEKTNAKIVILGNFFTRVTDTIKKYPDFFNHFCDYVITDEIKFPTLIKLLQNMDNADEVSNIIYLKNNQVKENRISEQNIKDYPVIDLSDFDLEKYLTPEIVLAEVSSRGCYWGKCSFCDHGFGQKMNIKPVVKFIDELEFLNKKYGIKHFELIDECIHPNYLYEMSKEILKRGLDINWFNYARLEEGFNEEVLTTAYKAGLKMLLWGFESASKKVMKDINKGIDIEKREDILRLARKIGIWNFAFIFFGFPTETKEDAIETIEYIKNHTDIISSYGRSVFTLGKHTTLREHPKKFSITKIYPDKEEFSPMLHFETSTGMNEKEVNEIAEKCLKECNAAYKNPLWMYLIYREILFLYICKYGADKVESTSITQSLNYHDKD